jgi:hypothetical protein
VRTAWYLYGLLLFAHWGKTRFVGCLACTRTQVLQTLAKTAVLGWWCFPWGFGTPLIIVQNLASAFGGPNRAGLRSLLAERGMDLDALEANAAGRSLGQERLRAALLFVLHEMVWADGHVDPREIRTSLAVASRLLGEPAEALRPTLEQPTSPDTPDFSRLAADARPILLRGAATVAAADDVVDPAEIDTLRALGERLQLPDSTIDTVINGLLADEVSQRERRNMLALATEVLGVGPEISAFELQARYRSLLLDAVGDGQEAAQAAAQAEQLSWAYGVLQSDLRPL